MKAVVLATDGVEDIELVTCVDVLRRGGIHVDLVSAGTECAVRCANGTNIHCDGLLSTCTTEYDLLVLPGGAKAAHHFSHDPHVQHLIKTMHGGKKWISAICASPMALSRAGVFAGGVKATIYPGMEGELVGGGASVVGAGASVVGVVRDGRVVTSRGPATAIAFALELVECVAGRERRDRGCQWPLGPVVYNI